MTRYVTCVGLALGLTLAGSFALAQSPGTAHADDGTAPVPPAAPSAFPASTAVQRGYFSVNAAYQGTSNSFTSGWSLPYYLETGSVSSSYSIKPGVLIDVGAGVRVWRNLTIGAAVSRYHRSELASVTASVPHPLLYNQPRTFSGTAAGPSRTESAIHANAMWIAAAAPRIQIGVFGGPSVFNVNQVVISAVNFAEVYPYTSVTVANTTTQSQTKSKIGFNAGGDVTILLYKKIGVGVLVRYSGVTIGVTGPAGAPLSIKAGGLQAGAGLRVRF